MPLALRIERIVSAAAVARRVGTALVERNCRTLNPASICRVDSKGSDTRRHGCVVRRPSSPSLPIVQPALKDLPNTLTVERCQYLFTVLIQNAAIIFNVDIWIEHRSRRYGILDGPILPVIVKNSPISSKSILGPNTALTVSGRSTSTVEASEPGFGYANEGRTSRPGKSSTITPAAVCESSREPPSGSSENPIASSCR